MPAYKDEKTGTWYSKFRYKDWNGTTKDKMKRGFATKRDAVQWENAFKSRQAGDLDMTFADFVKIYEDERFPRLKRSTQLMKINIIDKWLLPYFGAKKLDEIEPTDIVKWQNEMLKAINPLTGLHYTKSYLKTVHNQINAIFNYACRYYKLRQNPASIAGNMGSENDLKIHFWTTAQYKKFAEEMMPEPIYYMAFEVLYWAGLREGEMLALTKSDINFKEKTITVNKTYQVLEGNHTITSPKTKKSNRTVRIADTLCDELKNYINHLPGLDDDDRIFATVTKSALSRHIKKGAEKAGLPEIRVHDLRHSHVSLLIDMGFNPVAIAERMGHESITITYHYAHLFPSTQDEMAGKLDNLMEGTDDGKDGDDNV